MTKLRVLFFSLFASLMIITTWLLFSSSLLVNHVSMTVVKDKQGEWLITAIRQTPIGTVTGSWVAEYRVLGREDGMSCQGSGATIYSELEGDVVRYKAPAWAIPCLNEGPPISVTYIRTIYLFDFIPLRPAIFTFVISPEEVPIIPEGDTQ